MKQQFCLIATFALLAGLACNKVDDKATGSEAGAKAASSEKPLKIGYVLHVLNDFSESIRRGAEDAGKDLSAQVDIQGPAGSSAQDAIAIFEGMMQRRLDALAVIPAPGDVWVSPIRRASKAGIPVVTANITSPESEAPAWFGQDEYQSGVLLAQTLVQRLGSRAAEPGKVVVGICHPGVAVLTARYDGVVKGLASTKLEVSQPRDVTVPNATNYAAWESLVSANPDAVAFVGLCSMDVPNLAKVKARAPQAKWLVAGYDLTQEALDALKTSKADLLIGQNPYLQGYLPVRSLVEHVRQGKPLPRGWVDVGTEVVTAENAGQVYGREVDRNLGKKLYAQRLKERFVDLGALAKPLPKGS
jgi:ABC-type sugar transport system substrate-binding protein